MAGYPLVEYEQTSLMFFMGIRTPTYLLSLFLPPPPPTFLSLPPSFPSSHPSPSLPPPYLPPSFLPPLSPPPSLLHTILFMGGTFLTLAKTESRSQEV